MVAVAFFLVIFSKNVKHKMKHTDFGITDSDKLALVGLKGVLKKQEPIDKTVSKI